MIDRKHKSVILKKISKVIYVIFAALITGFLIKGIIQNKQYAFNTLRTVSLDSFYIRVCSILLVILIVQFIILMILNKKFYIFKLVTAITVSNFIGMYLVFLIFAIKNNINFIITNFDLNYFSHLILGRLLFPGSLIWGHPATYQGNEDIYFNSLPSAIAFVFIATIITSLIMWLWLRKDTLKPKSLFIAICSSSFILYIAVSVFMWFAY